MAVDSGGAIADAGGMLRPRKKYTVYDLQKLKGKRCLTHIHVKSPEEAAAAEEAGVDLMSCSFDSPESQARLPLLVEAAPNSFLSGATPHGLASPEEAIRVGFAALEAGAEDIEAEEDGALSVTTPWENLSDVVTVKIHALQSESKLSIVGSRRRHLYTTNNNNIVDWKNYFWVEPI